MFKNKLNVDNMLQVGNLGLLFFLLFFIFAALGVELFGRLECSDEIPCQGLGEHAHFANFGMAFLTLFRVATGDNWNGIMKDTLRDDCDDAADCVRNCCVSTVIAPIFFVIFVLMAQFVLVNVVVAVLMKHLEESHKQMEEDLDMDTQLERELAREQEFENDQALCNQIEEDPKESLQKRPLTKVPSLPKNFQYSTPVAEKKSFNNQRRQTVQYFNPNLGLSEFKTYTQNANMFNKQNSFSEAAEMSFNNDSEFDSSIETEILKKPTRRTTLTSSYHRPRLGKQTSFDETKRHEYRRPNYESFIRKSDKTSILSKIVREEVNIEKSSNKDDTIAPTQRDKATATKDIISAEEQQTKDKSTLSIPTITELERPKSPHPFKKSFSLDVAPVSTKSFLAVPKLQPRSRSGSVKQLFKQAALEEDPDGDENSLLLPTICKQNSTDSETQDTTTETVVEIPNPNKLAPEKNEKGDNIKKSDSTEILRIISERRRMDKKESESEHADHSELLASKSIESTSSDI